MITRPRNLSQADPYFDSVVLLAPLSGEDGDTTSTDLSNSAHALTFVDNAQLDGDMRKFGFTSLYCDGTGDLVTAPDSTDWEFGTGQFTVEGWVRYEVDPSGSNVAMVGHYQPTGDERGWAIDYDQTRLRFAWTTNGQSGTHDQVTYNWNPAADTWYYLTVSRDGSNLYMFIDGVLVASPSNTVNIYAATSTLSIGAFANAGFLMQGWIENLRITKGVCRYTSTFTPPERAFPTSISASIEIVLDGLAFDVDPADTNTYSGAGTDITERINSLAGLVEGATFTDGHFSYVTNDYLRFPNTTDLDLSAFSIDLWIRANSTGQSGFLFEKGTVNTQYAIFLEANVLTFRSNISGLKNMISLSPASTYINTVDWFHIVATFTSGAQVLYINGVSEGTGTQTGTPATNAGGMSIGAYGGYTGAHSYYYDGDIGPVKVYNKVLIQAEVDQNFNALRERFGV